MCVCASVMHLYAFVLENTQSIGCIGAVWCKTCMGKDGKPFLKRKYTVDVDRDILFLRKFLWRFQVLLPWCALFSVYSCYGSSWPGAWLRVNNFWTWTEGSCLQTSEDLSENWETSPNVSQQETIDWGLNPGLNPQQFLDLYWYTIYLYIEYVAII